MRIIARAALVLGLFLASPHPAIAFEPFQTHPGTRAMGMAGMFVAQADDSSAIWYNPAGPKSEGAAKSDVSVEFANAPRVDDDGGYARGGAKLKFLGGYTEKNLAILGDGNPVVIGAGYFLPYRVMTNVDRPRSALDSTPYGNIDVVHHQISALIAAAPSRSFMWGATLDAMGSEISCRDYPLCVKKNGPIGYGASLGAKYSVAKFASGQVSIAAAWRSRIALNYESRPATGLGSVIEDYLPGRPESIVLGVHLRTSTSIAAININGQAERAAWSETTKDASIEDTRAFGIGAEALFPVSDDDTFVIRAGVRSASAVGGSSVVRVIAAGVGYGFAQRHSVDIAVERRSLRAGVSEVFASLSYSIQP